MARKGKSRHATRAWRRRNGCERQECRFGRQDDRDRIASAEPHLGGARISEDGKMLILFDQEGKPKERIALTPGERPASSPVQPRRQPRQSDRDRWRQAADYRYLPNHTGMVFVR